MKYFLGIDPGVTGAWALIDGNGKFIAVDNVDIMRKGKGSSVVKNYINPKGLLDTFNKSTENIDKSSIVVYLENVHSWPQDAPHTAFSLGDSFGAIRAVVACMGLRLELVTPQAWKKHFKIPAEKEISRSLAIQLFPEASSFLKRNKDGDRAEALLIALYGKEKNK